MIYIYIHMHMYIYVCIYSVFTKKLETVLKQ